MRRADWGASAMTFSQISIAQTYHLLAGLGLGSEQKIEERTARKYHAMDSK